MGKAVRERSVSNSLGIGSEDDGPTLGGLLMGPTK